MQDQQWCIASPGATDPELDGFLKFVCSQLDCSAINPGGQCFQPNTYRNHGSYALDLYYRAKGICNTDIGMPSVVDPCTPSSLFLIPHYNKHNKKKNRKV